MTTFSSPVGASTPPTSLTSADPKLHRDGLHETVKFTDVATLFRVVDSNKDFVVFSGIDNDDMKQIEAGRERRRRAFRFHFRPEQKLLQITVPLYPHEMICGAINEKATIACSQMGLRINDFRFVGATTYRGKGGSGGDGSGEGDSAFVPTSRMWTKDKWPTFIVEAGLSESLASLRSDMRWWFQASQQEVKIVLLAKLYRDAREIRLEKYIKDTSHTRTGATYTRSTPQLRPQLVQVITITPCPNSPGQLPQYTSIGGPLILEFELLFLRSPDLAAGERDIEFSPLDLELAAQAVWA